MEAILKVIKQNVDNLSPDRQEKLWSVVDFGIKRRNSFIELKDKYNNLHIITSHKSLRVTRLVEEYVSRLGRLLNIRG